MNARHIIQYARKSSTFNSYRPTETFDDKRCRERNGIFGNADFVKARRRREIANYRYGAENYRLFQNERKL